MLLVGFVGLLLLNVLVQFVVFFLFFPLLFGGVGLLRERESRHTYLLHRRRRRRRLLQGLRSQSRGQQLLLRLLGGFVLLRSLGVAL